MSHIELNDDQQQHAYAAAFVDEFMEIVKAKLTPAVANTIYVHTRFLHNNTLMIVGIRTKLFIDLDLADCEILSIESSQCGIHGILGKKEWLAQSLDRFIFSGLRQILPCYEAEAILRFYDILGGYIQHVEDTGVITGYLLGGGVSFSVEQALIHIHSRPKYIVQKAQQLNAMYLKSEELGIPFN